LDVIPLCGICHASQHPKQYAPYPWKIQTDRLRHLRDARVLSQSELAKEAGVALRTIGALERGEGTAHPATIRKLAKVLGVEPGELVVAGS
jgi:DNA-binding XRE family transcriptional regulator